jgi:glycosyltransferase involved in cell wall biosynthesis
MSVPVTVAAKNESRALGPCLDALLESIRHAASRGIECALWVVLDDCSDDSESIARGRGVETRRSSGGKVEAQRVGLRPGPFNVFVDADVLVTPPTLAALVETLRDRPAVQVVFPPRTPLEPVSRGRLARALHVYNRERGFSSQRTWFNGKCFAIRQWQVPTLAELAPRIERLPVDRFYDYAAGMRIDDIYLSRRIVAEHGPAALAETDEGCVYYRAPETLRGMYRYYRRMRMELERIGALFPELDAAYRAHGARRADRLAAAPLEQRVVYLEFQLALALCRVGYRAERAYYQHLARSSCPAWPPVEETKCSLDTTTRG